MIQLDLSKKSLSFLDKLPPKQFRQVVKTIFSLMVDPEPHDSKELRGHPFRRVDIGEYRIIYRVEAEILKIFFVGKRNDGEVYRHLR